MRPLWWLLGCLASCDAAAILALLPYLGASHFAFFRPLLEALAARGHNLTVVSHFPRASPPAGWRDMSLRGLGAGQTGNHLPMSLFDEREVDWLVNMRLFQSLLPDYEAVKDAVRASLGPADLVLTEAFNTEAWMVSAAPVVALSSSPVMPWTLASLGSPDSPALLPSVFSETSVSLTLADRLANSLALWGCRLFHWCFLEPYSQALARDVHGPVPPLSQAAANLSLLLVNSHFSLHGPRPYLPNVVDVAGLHIPPPSPLPKDLARFLADSKDGVIYMSLGSMVRGESLPPHKLEIFLSVFSRLKQRIVWKWEGPRHPNMSENIFTSSWLPQSDLLCDQSIQAYITHGGLLGVVEAVNCGVPMVGIPLFGDQHHNLASLTSTGMAVKLRYISLTREGLEAALDQVLTRPEYRDTARRMAQAFRDRPMSPLDTAVYWTEYVLRHRGAPFLKSPAAQLSWYQHYLLDVFAIYLAVILTLLVLLYLLLKTLCSFLVSLLPTHKPAPVKPKIN